MTNNKSNAMRFNSNKMRFNLIPMDAMTEIARVFSVGSLKYEDGNWLAGMPYSTMIDSASRHFALWQMGQEIDPDTGCLHIAMLAWNAIALLTYSLRGLGVDDRIKLPIDHNFNWTEGPAKDLKIGLSPDELEALRVKYTALREKHKAEKNGVKQ